MRPNANAAKLLRWPADPGELSRKRVIYIASDAKARLETLGLLRVLERRGHHVRVVVPTPSRARELEQADVLLFAPGPGDDSTATTVRQLRDVGLMTGIAILNERLPEALGERVLNAGADLLLNSRENPAQVASKLEALVRRVRGDWTSMLDYVAAGIHIDLAARTIAVGRESVKLSPTNLRLFLYFLEHFERWIPEARIIRDVIGTNHAPGTSIVRVHVCALRKAIEPLRLRVEHRRQVGYRLAKGRVGKILTKV